MHTICCALGIVLSAYSLLTCFTCLPIPIPCLCPDLTDSEGQQVAGSQIWGVYCTLCSMDEHCRWYAPSPLTPCQLNVLSHHLSLWGKPGWPLLSVAIPFRW